MKSVAARVKSKVDSLKEGEIFDYSSFNISDNEIEATAKALSRLNREGVIKRLSRGKYYKPKVSRFGELKPSENEILSKYVKNGYITGINLYNRLGLTSQVSNQIEVAINRRRSMIDLGSTKIKFVKSSEEINYKNRKVLPILDALKNVKKIPDADINNSIKILKTKLNQFDANTIKVICNSVLKYNPATRALTGALLEEIDNNCAVKIRKSLNNLSTYRIGVSQEIVPNKIEWNII